MGILDRLRRTAPADPVEPAALEAAPEEPTLPEPAPEDSSPEEPAPVAGTPPGDDGDGMPEFRGDFMLLPPMRPTFGRPAMLQRSLDDFLTTHRPVTLTTQPLAHEIEPERLGMVTARARRPQRSAPRLPSGELTHRQAPDELEEEMLDALPDLPPAAPRRLRATAQAPSRPDLTGQMPTISHVSRAVRASGAPQLQASAPAAKAPQGPVAELEAVREAARMDPLAAAPVMRRRGGAGEPAAPSPEPIPPASAPSRETDVDLDSLTAPSAAEMPVIASPPRVRGAQPPAASAGESRPTTRPLLGVDRGPDPAPVPDEAAESPAPAELAHRASEAAGGAAGSLPSGAAPVEPSSPPTSPSVQEATSPVTSRPRPTRPLLGAQAPPTASSSSAGAPVSAGSTGVQRKARSGSAPAAPVATPAVAKAAPSTAASIAPSTAPLTAPPASMAMLQPGSRTSSAPSSTSPGSMSSTPPASESPEASTASTSPGTQRKARSGEPAGTEVEAGPPESQALPDAPDAPPQATAIAVPAEVRRAVAEVAGSAPETAMVHIGEHANDQTNALNAEAFTRDGEIYLASDAALDTSRGQALLAHELTHVVQQEGGQKSMPDERSDEGQEHERAALQVERVMAQPPSAPDPVELHHAGSVPSAGSPVSAGVSPGSSAGIPSRQATRRSGTESALPSVGSGAEPALVPSGVQRRSRALNPSLQDDDDRMALPPAPVMEPASASALQPSLKQQVDLVHASRTGDAGATLAGQLAASGIQRPQPATAARPEPTSAGLAPISTNVSVTSAGEAGGSGGGPGAAGSMSSEVARPEKGALEKGLGYFSRMMAPPEGPSSDDESDRGELERQADSLYPLLRSRLRAELVRDLERRGRMTREWR